MWRTGLRSCGSAIPGAILDGGPSATHGPGEMPADKGWFLFLTLSWRVRRGAQCSLARGLREVGRGRGSYGSRLVTSAAHEPDRLSRLEGKKPARSPSCRRNRWVRAWAMTSWGGSPFSKMITCPGKVSMFR